MYAFIFKNGNVHRHEYPSHEKLMVDATKRGLTLMLHYPGHSGYIIRLAVSDKEESMMMHAADPKSEPILDLSFYHNAFDWLSTNRSTIQQMAYNPLMSVGDGPCVLKPQPDSGSNWGKREYNEWLDGTMDVFVRFLCLQEHKK
jgi:hypothetical protein